MHVSKVSNKIYSARESNSH